MRATGGVYPSPAPRLSFGVGSVAIMLASVTTQNMALWRGMGGGHALQLNNDIELTIRKLHDPTEVT